MMGIEFLILTAAGWVAGFWTHRFYVRHKDLFEE